MKIYFAGSIRGGRQDQELYLKLIEHLKNHGTVLTEHIGNSSLTAKGDSLNEADIFKRDIAWINEADIIVAEVTTPSLGVGYEIALSQTLGKPLLVLFRPNEGRKLSAMIAGITNLKVQNYTSFDEVATIINEFMKQQ